MRDLFLKKTANYNLTVILWDEFGSTFPPRGMSPNAPWVASHVAQFNSLVGAFHLENRKVILIAADNRVDLIDPAVIREGRFNFKKHVPRPEKSGVVDLFMYYLPETLPIHKSAFTRADQTQKETFREGLIFPFVEELFDEKSKTNRLIEIKPSGGEKEVLGFKDLFVSGAMAEALAEKAKLIAYNRWTETKDPEEKGVKLDDLRDALDEKTEANLHLPTTKSAIDDWLKTEGIDGDYTVKFLGDGKEVKIGFMPASSEDYKEST